MSESQNETSVRSENSRKGLPKFAIAICYILLVVLLLVGIFFGVRTYGDMQMRTSVGYALGARKSFSIFMALNEREMDNVTITVINQSEDSLTLLPENMLRRISIELRYMQFIKLPSGGSETRYDTLKETIIEFANEESANEYFNEIEKNETRDQFVLHRYYFDLVPEEELVYNSGDLDTEEFNAHLRSYAVMDIRRVATGFGPFIYKIFG
ncbi:MAG: hypothetical protein J1F65_06130 [Clostridiales bacterium]|nr:hypothetical protein [Clostridiales bacterium]